MRPVGGHHLVPVLLDVPLFQYGNRPQVVQRLDVVGSDPRGVELPPVEGALPIGVFEQPLEPSELQLPQFLGRKVLGAFELPQVAQFGPVAAPPPVQGVQHVTDNALVERHC